MSEGRKSPIKDKPLRNAGQSLEQEYERVISETLETPLLTALMLVLLAALEWWRYYTDAKPSPVLFTGVAVVATGFVAWKIVKARPKLRSLKQGIEGEKAVGQFLERLRLQGYEVFHDIVAPGFNIDHVLIGPAGVFSVETKTWSKPDRGAPKISFDGEQLLADGMTPDRNLIIQAKAQASWLRNLLSDSTGRNFNVLPIVLFPGWFIEPSRDSLRGIWVLEPKALPSFLGQEPQRLDASESKLAAFHLSRFIRSVEREQAA